MSTKSLKWIIPVVIVAVGGLFGYKYWQERKSALPEGIYAGNGRIEAKLVDIGPKEALRIKEILVDEGDMVQPGQVLVRMDTVTLEAQLAEAKANVIATREREATVKAAIVKAKSELNLANIELDRAGKLLKENAGSQREFDMRKAAVETDTAGVDEQEARLRTATYEAAVAEANVATVQTRIDDATLYSPVRGRVLYRLAEVGEVLAPGGKALTLVNLNSLYMEIFLPSQEAARVKIGNDARIAFDVLPGRAIPGYVSFVSPEAQFTPKQVETKSEREKLMFRVKIQVPEELVEPYIQNTKTGVRGVGYVKVNDSIGWPQRLQTALPPLERSQSETSTSQQRPSSAPAKNPALSKPAESAPASPAKFEPASYLIRV